MSKLIAIGVALVVAAGWTVSAGAESEQKLDNQGRVVRQVEADGSRVVHTYAPDGSLIKRETSRGERVHFDKKGRVGAGTPAAPNTNTQDKR
jgi:YD repeat-containing protein